MNHKKTNILLVEDDPINQFVASSLLRKWGMQVVISNDGAEAVAQICSKAFQLVLMDIQMPVMDGFESTSRIRAMDDLYFKTVPIIACTASSMISVQEMAVEKGMNDFITKPLEIEELQIKINKYLPALRRPLFINFNLYTDGDPDFKKELISLLVGNISELQHSLLSIAQTTSKIFLGVLHKVDSTVGMLCDQEFSQTLEEIKTMCIMGQEGEPFHRKLNHFSGLCNQVIESLHAASTYSNSTNNQLLSSSG
jgi:CheY-like chemotaxis protein